MEHHIAKRVDDLMYRGCEPHWQCVKCGECVPFHCYSKEEFERKDCKTANSKVPTAVSQRKQITKCLSDLLEKHINPNNDTRIYFAKEVTFDYSKANSIRVDYLLFTPENNTIGGIEQGKFSCYEIKSCKDDFKSGCGLNFIGDYNYVVFPSVEVYKQCETYLPYYVGIYVADSENSHIYSIKKAQRITRKYATSEMLLMMFRSANREIIKAKKSKRKEV